jgi:hypothetical protein
MAKDRDKQKKQTKSAPKDAGKKPNTSAPKKKK